MTSSYESLFNWLPPSSSPLGLAADDPHSLDMPLIDRSESALLSNLLASGPASFSPTPASYHNNKSIASTTSTTIRKRAAHEMSSTTSSTTSYGLNDELSMLKRMYAGAHSVLGHASSNAVSVQATPLQSAHSKFAGDSTTMMTPPPPQGAAGSLAPTAAAVNHFMYELTHNGSFAPLPSSSNASVEYLYVDDGVSAKKHTSSTSATSGGVGAVLGVSDASHVDAVTAAALAASVSASSPVAAAASPTPSDPYALQSPPPPSLPLLADLSAMHAHVHVPPPYVPPPAEPAPPLSAYDSAVRINAIFSARHALGEYLPSGTGSNNNSSGDDATTNPNAEDDAIDPALLESDGVRRMKRRATDKQRRAKIKDGLELLRSLVALHGNSSTDQASIVLSSVDLVQQLVSQATALRDDVRTAQHEAAYLKSLAAKCESAVRSGFTASSVLSSGAAASASASAGAASSVTAHGKHGNSSRRHTRSSSSAAKAAPVAPRQQVHRASTRAAPSSQQHDVYPGPSIITHQPATATATATVARMPVAATRAAPAAPTLTSSPESIHHRHHQSNAPLPFYTGAGLAPVAPAHIVSAPVYSATTFDRAPSYNAAVSSLSSSQSQSSSSSQSYHTDAMYGSTSMMYEPVVYPTSATTSLSSSYHSVSRSSENVVNAVASYGPTVGYESSSSVASSSSPSMMTNSADMWSMRWDQSALGRSSSLGMPADFSLFRSSSIDQSLPFSAYPPQALPQSSSQVHEQQQHVQHYPQQQQQQQQQQYQPHAATSTIESASEAAQHPQPTIAGLVEELQALTAAASLLSATSAARGHSPVSSSSSSASPVPTTSVSPSAASVAVAVPSSSSSLAHSPQPSTSFSSPSPSAAAPTSLVAKLIQSDPSLAESLDNLLLNSYFLQTLRVLSKQPASSSSSSSP